MDLLDDLTSIMTYRITLLVVVLCSAIACDRTVETDASATGAESNSKALATAAGAEPGPVDGAPSEPSPAAQAVDAPSGAAVKVSPTASREALEKAVCSQTKPCHVTDVKDAGADGFTRLQVVEIAYVDDPKPGFKNADLNDCNKWALALVRTDGGTISTIRRLVEFCNDGYGASGVGEDSWEIDGTQLKVGTYGGSNWRWYKSTTVDLATMKLVESTDDSFFSSNPDIGLTTTWNYDRFAGQTSSKAELCGSAGGPKTWRANPIPSVVIPKGYDWKFQSLGDCASVIDGHEGEGWSSGYVIHGDQGSADDTSMKVLAGTNNVLYVDVTDDKLVASKKSWIHGDHLELWTSPEEPKTMEFDCLDPNVKGTAWQWGIDAVDGTVHTAHGKPTAKLEAERIRTAKGVRYRVELPAEAKSVTVVYSDSDDGTSQERLIATSAFEFGRVQSMGTLRKIDSKYATCELDAKELALERKPIDGPIPHF